MLLALRLWALGALASGLAPPQVSPATPLRRGFEVVATFDTSTLDGATRAPLALQVLDPRRFPTPSKAKRACRRAEVALNGRTARCGDDVNVGDVLELRARTCVESYLQARFRSAKAPFELKVAYEDDYLAVVVKPSGRPTHSEGQGRMNLRSAVPFALRPPARVDDGDRALSRPQPVHRLDKATSGLVLCAKTKKAAVEASRMFAERRVKNGAEIIHAIFARWRYVNTGKEALRRRAAGRARITTRRHRRGHTGFGEWRHHPAFGKDGLRRRARRAVAQGRVIDARPLCAADGPHASAPAARRRCASLPDRRRRPLRRRRRRGDAVPPARALPLRAVS